MRYPARTGGTLKPAELPLRYAACAIVALGVLFGVARPARADYIVPGGLNPGDHYRLIFETSSTFQASSSSISTYNQDVNQAAATNAQLPATTWYAVASVGTGSDVATSAASNITCSVACMSAPVFTISGVLVATSSTTAEGGLLSGALQAAPGVDDMGQFLGGLVWTGSNADGTPSANATLGNTYGGANPQYGGYATVGRGGWVDTGWLRDTSVAVSQNSYLPLYAISGDLVVGGKSIPEPASLAFVALGVLALAGLRFRPGTAADNNG